MGVFGKAPPRQDNSGGGFWGFVGNIAKTALDATTGISSMINDVQTIVDGNSSWQDKLLAGGDLLLNAGMDALALTGVGELVDIGIRAGIHLAEHIGADLVEHAAADVVEHAVADTAEHIAADTVEHTASDTVDHTAADTMQHAACSFTFLTLVTTDHGEQAIGTLHVGDKVLAYNPKTHTMEQEPVLHVWVHSDNDLIDLTITTTTKGQHGKPAHSTSEVVHTNQKHPFLTIEKGFLPVGQIALGMHVRRADGTIGVITGWKVVPGTRTMYNLEVAQDHTFTVGSGQWVVHNCNVGFGNNKAPIDMKHVLDGHSNGTYQSLLKRSASGDQKVAAVLAKDTYFVGQTDEDVGKIVREAWTNRVKAGAQQVDPMGVVRQMWRGVGRGWQVEGWYNLTERIVETAYPIFP